MKRKICQLSFLALCLWARAACAQDTPAIQEGDFTFDTDKPFKLLELEEKVETPVVIPKAKPRRKIFYGLKTRKAFTMKGQGKSKVIELFYVLKKPDPIRGFVRDYYWFDYTRHELRRTASTAFDPKYGALSHGPYKKMAGDQILEEGIFYKGTKHGRWMQYDRRGILNDKEKYYKGWPKESEALYYDPDARTKLKEVIPIEFGEKEGYYYYFHENGKIAVMGEYRWDKKVGDWIENYENGKRKKIIAYPKDPFDEETKSYIRKEWDEAGKEIYSATQKPKT